jgi:heptosyltransferase-2
MSIKKTFDKLLGSMTIPLIASAKTPPRSQPESIKKLLIVRLFGMGDAVLVASLISEIKRKHKKIKIHILATDETKKIFEMSEADKIYTLNVKPRHIITSFLRISSELKKEGYDATVDTEQFANLSAIIITRIASKFSVGYALGSRSKLYDKTIRFNASKHTLSTFSDLFSAIGLNLSATSLFQLKVSRFEVKRATRFLKKNKINPHDILVGIHPGTGDTATFRRWMPKRFADVADHLAEKYNAKILLTGTKNEEKLLHLIASNMYSKPKIITSLSLQQFTALTKRFNIFISNDTGPMHIAAAMGTPTIGIFGPNTPIRWAPLNKASISIYKNFSCSPCINTHLGIVPKKCTLYKTARCMEAITPLEVVRAAHRIMKTKR